MKGKILPLMFLILLSISFVAAQLTEITKPADLTQSKNSTYFTIKNVATYDLNITLTHPTLRVSDTNGHYINLALTPDSLTDYLLSAGNETKIEASVSSIDSDFDFELGNYNFPAITILAEKSTDDTIKETKTAILTFVDSFCKYGEVGKLKIDEIEDKTIDNEDEWEWHPLDNIEFSVDVTNSFDAKKTVKVEYELYDPEKTKFVDLGDNNYDSISIDEDEDETLKFALRVPADLDAKEYRLYVKAIVKGHENEGCADTYNSAYYQKVNIVRDEDRAIVVDPESIQDTLTAMCGDLPSIDAKIYNIGEEEEEKIKVNLYNKELGIDLNREIDNLDAGDGDTVNFNFPIPAGAKEKTYVLVFTTFFEYDEDKDFYDSNSEDDLDKTFKMNLKVEGGCATTKKDASISASLQSEAKAGQELIVKATIKNTGQEETNYLLSLTGYESWAELSSIQQTSLTLKSGESKDVLINLKPFKDAAGTKTFSIKTIFDSLSKEQLVEVNIASSGITGFNISNLGEVFQGNWFLWVIVIVNIILIILIIIVAVRVSR